MACDECRYMACAIRASACFWRKEYSPRTVMEIAGHSAIEMTMNVYGHVNLETQRKALDDLDRSLA